MSADPIDRLLARRDALVNELADIHMALFGEDEPHLSAVTLLRQGHVVVLRCTPGSAAVTGLGRELLDPGTPDLFTATACTGLAIPEDRVIATATSPLLADALLRLERSDADGTS